jgi:hypothetical protein
MSLLRLWFGDLLFNFSGEFCPATISAYFPNRVDKKTSVLKEYEIVISGEFNKAIPCDPLYSVKNFMETEYQVYAFSKRRQLLISVGNEYEDHAILFSGNKFEVFYLSKDTDGDVKWAIRLCRELILLNYIYRGYVPFHASGVSFAHNKAIISFGSKGSGKTTALCSFVDSGCSILSNDLVLIGRKMNGNWEAIGWPWKVTIGNDLAVEMGLRVDIRFQKQYLLPLDFCREFGCNWDFFSMPYKFLIPSIKTSEVLSIRQLSENEFYSYLQSFGFEFPFIYDIFRNVRINIDYSKMFRAISNEFLCYFASGNLWNHRRELFSLLCI